MYIQWHNSDKSFLLEALKERKRVQRHFLTFIVYKDVFKLREKHWNTKILISDMEEKLINIT